MLCDLENEAEIWLAVNYEKSMCSIFLERVCLLVAFCAVIMCFHLFKFKQVSCNKKGDYLGDPNILR